MMPPLPQFSCPVYTMDDWFYWKHRYQYATTSNPAAIMSPGAIICPQYPNADADVTTAIEYAVKNHCAIAIRTGGHAYSGTSSTDSNNIQLDLSDAYKDWKYDAVTGLLTVGVSYTLLEFNTQLAKAGLFMPTGQCSNVHLGGHVQTGGYGQLTRAFGLLADHILSFDIFLADGKKRTVTPADDLFFAVLGGGPGNYGIMTHVTFRALKDLDHNHSCAFRKVIPYDPKLDHDVLVRLFKLVRDWESAPGDYDFSFTVASAEDNFFWNYFGIASYDDFLVRLSGKNPGSSPFNFLSVYFQYSNLDNTDSYDRQWCNKIKTILADANKTVGWWDGFKNWVKQKLIDHFVPPCDDGVPTPISKSVTKLWTYQGTREFNYPFLKNVQLTDQVADPDKWPEWVASRIDDLIARSEGCMVVTQCENFGGPNSAMRKNAARKQTSYAWRDTTVGYCLDAFYNPNVPNARWAVGEWQKVNNCEGIGPCGKLSKVDHRWFCFSHGDTNMSDVWQFYYSPEDYHRCLEIKKKYDPNGVFTPNSFVVGYPDTAPKHVA